MANLKEVRNRITSVKSTQQITKAMKMVSAAKLRRAQDAVEKMRPYEQKLTGVLQNLSEQVGEEYSNPFLEVREKKRVLLVPITADRGLAGSFNSNVIKETKRLLKEEYKQFTDAGQAHIYSVGKKGYDHFSKYGFTVVGHNNHIFSDLSLEWSNRIAKKLMDFYRDGEYDEIVIIFNQFKNAAIYFTTPKQFLPVQQNEEQPSEEAQKMQNVNYIFEPDMESLLDELIPRALRTTVYRALLDSNAAEHGARMTAMDAATENAEDLLRDLRLQYNKARQGAITGELLDIVGGARALEE